ncbi:hypothetical protein ACFQHV_00710 [Promicromonospora thailandica]|uniref:Uncharacterized protein n=1 Tax=Promicromonospora thailandica TaxID=765201 RepID=A0A9X2JSQ0_9MICO|nr:hypothetical protein [Promicromonospora thailandica]MCP2262740.1 hypothetical protein [Promicromonospora thailandica]BFF18065.1 hypothetical protein GCM10025730_15860 [Promicromonospora thailandica]
MQDVRSLRAWVWVIAVLGYLILPVVAFFSLLGLGPGEVFGRSGGLEGLGGVAGIGMFVIPVLTWVITVALHRERRAHGERAVDGVVLNWVGGMLIVVLVLTTAGASLVPRITDYLERHEPGLAGAASSSEQASVTRLR